MSGFLLRVVLSGADDIWISTEDLPFTRIHRCADSLSVFTGSGRAEADAYFRAPPDGGYYRCFIMNDRGDSIDNFTISIPVTGKVYTDIPGGRSVLLEDCQAPLIIQHVEIEGGKVRRRLRFPSGGLMTIADCQRLATELLADVA